MERNENQPVRPLGLPLETVWDAEQRHWRLGATDDAGRNVGTHRVFREDGSLESETVYVDGLPHGRFVRFHPNGETAREGTLERGRIVGPVVAYSSTAVAGEPLARCCVPDGAWKMVITQYGGVHREAFFDRAGDRLLSEGGLQPPPPAGVPGDATYVPERDLWELPTLVPEGEMSTWRRWNGMGELVEACDYKNGMVNGVRARYEREALQSSWTFREGFVDGPGRERISAGTYEDTRIAWIEGQFASGVRVGLWRCLDDDGRGLYETNFGVGLSKLERDDDCLVAALGSERDVAGAILAELAEQKEAKGAPIAAFVLRARRASLLGDREALLALTRALPALTEASSETALRTAEEDGQGEASGPEWQSARLLNALLRGARPARVFCALTRTVACSALAGWELASVALGFEPDAPEALAASFLYATELGRFEEAQRSLEHLRSVAPDAAPPLDVLLRVTLAPFGFLPASTPFEESASEELPAEVAQPPEALRAAISKTALRAGHLREALQGALSDAPFSTALAPDVSYLVETGTTLDSFSFETPDGDTVKVDEELHCEGASIGELMLQARREWATLCWLCYAAGLDEVGAPDETPPPDDFARAMTTAFVRHFRVEDQLQTGGFRARAQHCPDFAWQGIPIDEVAGRLLVQARDEFREMRAALYFAADDSCRSLWQDDLRG